MRRGFILLAVCCAVVVTAPGSQAGPSEGLSVRTFTSGDNSELHKTIPISRKRGTKSRVVMRLKAERIGDLRAGDRLLSSAEVEVTTCLDAPERPGYEDSCVGRVYPYDPHVSAKIILGNHRDSTKGEILASPRELECSQHHPNRNHHCVLVIPWKTHRLQEACNGCHVNLVMTAWKSKQARAGHQLIIGAHQKDDPVESDKGRLNLVRIRPGDTPVPAPKAGDRVGVRLPVAREGNKPKPVITRSLRLTDLRVGDEIWVDGRTRTNISSVPYNVHIQGRVHAARKRRATSGSGIVRYVAPNADLAENNGFNCTKGPSAHRNPCLRPRVGVVRIKKDVNELFINMSVSAQAKPNENNENSWRPGHRVKVTESHLRAYLVRGS